MGNAVLADGVAALALAGLVATLGFGAWSIPWLDDVTMSAGLARMYGPTIGALVCATLHVTSFAVKTLLVLLVLRRLAVHWPPIAGDRMTLLCLRVLIPIALANVFATGFWLVARPGLA
jgi:NADH:ubiquinone oxidoreductase subunit H